MIFSIIENCSAVVQPDHYSHLGIFFDILTWGYVYWFYQKKFLSLPEDIFSLLLEREEGRKRIIHWLPPVPPRLGIVQGTRAPGRGIGDGGSNPKPRHVPWRNQTCNLSAVERCSNQLSHSAQGRLLILEREEWRERDRSRCERETLIVCLSYTPLLGIELAT